MGCDPGWRVSDREDYERLLREDLARRERWLADQPLSTRMKMWPADALVGVTAGLVAVAPALVLIAVVALVVWLGSP